MAGDINVLKGTEKVVDTQKKNLERLDKNLQIPKGEK